VLMCRLHEERGDAALQITRLGNALVFTGSAVTDQQFTTRC